MCDAAITLIQGQLATSCSLSPIFSALATDFAGFGSTTTAADFTKPFNSFYESVCATGVYSCNNAVTTGSAAAGSQLGGAGVKVH